jgi:hypothetical protein
MIQGSGDRGKITLTATSAGFNQSQIIVKTK